MDKKKFGSKFLHIFEKLEYLYKISNRKLNANYLSKRVDSLFSRRVKIEELINLEGYGKATKAFINRKINLPKWATVDSFSKAVRLLIKNKFGVTTAIETHGSQSSKKNKSDSKIEINFKDKLINLFVELKQSVGKARSSLLEKKSLASSAKNSILRTFSFQTIFKRIGLSSHSVIKRQNEPSIKLAKNSLIIGVILYSDHLLTLARIGITPNKKVAIRGVVEVPIPGQIIGDNLVEDSNELADIILDLFNLLNLNNSPLLVVLSSSFFNIHTFSSSELKIISNTDYKVQSKSPYLPADTFVEFLRMSPKVHKDNLIRAVYSRKHTIESWTNMLETVNVPIIGLTPASPVVFDILTAKISERITILIDIDIKSTTVLIGSKSSSLDSFKLPYGASLYMSDSTYELSQNYFTRVFSSIKLAIEEYDEQMPTNIYVMGHGLDYLVKEGGPLPKKFRRVSDMGLVDYSYSPANMDIHELHSKSVVSTVDTLANIASSCL